MKYILRITKITAIFIIVLLVTTAVTGQKLKKWQKKSMVRMQDHIAYLASDELDGRSTGSLGEMKSATYIAGEFQKLGLTPKGSNNSYVQPFDVVTLRLADGASVFKMGSQSLKLFKDFTPLSYSSNFASVNSNIIECGFGIKDKQRDDYKGKVIKGNVVAINVSSPDGIHPHSKFIAWHGIQRRVDLAIELGAKGVVFYKDNEKTAAPETGLQTKIKPSIVPVIFLTKAIDKEIIKGKVLLRVKILTDKDEGHNVIGMIDNGASKTIVIGAHHDHLGHGEHGGSLADDVTEIHNGADDNASGVAGLIELANCIKGIKRLNKNANYLFIAFSGEEMGLLGSKYFVDNPTINLESVTYMVNMDMIGMLNIENPVLIINGVGTSPIFPSKIDELKLVGIKSIKTTKSGIGASDHTSFYLKGIPSIHFFTGQHEHYHKPTDDVENLNYKGQFWVVNTILNLVDDLSGLDKLEFTETKMEDGKSRMKFNVTLGIVPDYRFDGEGLRIDAVRDNKPGSNAGLKKGDIIIAFDGQSINSIQDYMKILSKLNKGVKSSLKVKRGSDFLDFPVQF